MSERRPLGRDQIFVRKLINRLKGRGASTGVHHKEPLALDPITPSESAVSKGEVQIPGVRVNVSANFKSGSGTTRVSVEMNSEGMTDEDRKLMEKISGVLFATGAERAAQSRLVQEETNNLAKKDAERRVEELGIKPGHPSYNVFVLNAEQDPKLTGQKLRESLNLGDGTSQGL